jgi:two-component system response regulator NreC
MSIKVLLADDHVILRHGVSKSLENEKDIEVVAQANNGHSTIQLTRELSPDVILMDIGMPGLNGIEATRIITGDFPKTKIIALSMHSAKKFVSEMFKAGASGYLLKDCDYDELTNAIRVVASGKKYISPSISAILVDSFSEDPTKIKKGDAFSILTTREREVLQLLAEGKTTKQIGKTLFISPKTVEAHRLNIMKKLQIDNIAQLTKYALQEGLTLPEV